MVFHRKLTRLRKSKGLSQEKLAEALEIHQTQVSRWELGSARPTMDQGLALARLLGVSYDYLADDSLDAPTPLAHGPQTTIAVLGVLKSLIDGAYEEIQRGRAPAGSEQPESSPVVMKSVARADRAVGPGSKLNPHGKDDPAEPLHK